MIADYFTSEEVFSEFCEGKTIADVETVGEDTTFTFTDGSCAEITSTIDFGYCGYSLLIEYYISKDK